MSASRSESETRVAAVGDLADTVREALSELYGQGDVRFNGTTALKEGRLALDALVAVALTYRQPTPCNCRVECMDADDEEGTCKGLPMPKEPPLVEMVLVPRALSPFPPTPEQEGE